MRREDSEDKAAQAGLRRGGPYLKAQALARAHYLGQPPHDAGDAAANLVLHFDGHDEQSEVVFGHALDHILERAWQWKSNTGLLEHGAKLTAQRVGEFLHGQLKPTVERMARFKRGLHEVERKRKLLDEIFESSRPAEPNVRNRQETEATAESESEQQIVPNRLAEAHPRCEHQHNDEQHFGDPHVDAGLPHVLFELAQHVQAIEQNQDALFARPILTRDVDVG